MDTNTDSVKVKRVCHRHSGATCLFLVAASTLMQFSEDFWIWLYKPEMVTVITY